MNFAHISYEDIQKVKKQGRTTTTKSIIKEKITFTDLLEDFTSLAEMAVPETSSSEGRKEKLLQWMNATITTHSYFQGKNT